MSTEDKLSEEKQEPVSQPEPEPEAKPEAPQPEKTGEASEEEPKEVKEEPKEESKAKESRAEKKAAKKEAEKKAVERAEKAEQELAVLNDKYLRLCAEYDNFRRRSQKEKEALYADVKADTAVKFLPVYDNLERALKQSTEDEAYRKGVEMIMTQFCATLEKLGISPIDCLGQTFDPSLHNAVMHVEDETRGDNEIVEVFQQGFKLGEKVIRFAMVKVAN